MRQFNRKIVNVFFMSAEEIDDGFSSYCAEWYKTMKCLSQYCFYIITPAMPLIQSDWTSEDWLLYNMCFILYVSVQQHYFLHNDVHWDVLVRLRVCVRDSVLSLLTRLHLFPPHKNSCRRLYGAGSALSGCGFLLASSRSERKLSSRADLRPAALPLGSESLFESSSLLHKKKSCFGVVVFLWRLRARPMRSRPWGVTELI